MNSPNLERNFKTQNKLLMRWRCFSLRMFSHSWSSKTQINKLNHHLMRQPEQRLSTHIKISVENARTISYLKQNSWSTRLECNIKTILNDTALLIKEDFLSTKTRLFLKNLTPNLCWYSLSISSKKLRKLISKLQRNSSKRRKWTSFKSF